MKIRHTFIIALFVAVGLGSQFMATAGEMKTHKHGPAMDKHTDESQGQPIRKINVKGYTLDYRLIDISQSMPDMAGT
jgi:hypothetical protein